MAVLLLLLYLYSSRRNSEKDGITLFGNVDVRLVDLGFQVAGRVSFMKFDEGDLVKTGELMAELDQQPYLDQVDQAQAALEAVKINLENANLILKRRQELIGTGGVSKEDLANALASRDALMASIKQSEATLGVAQTNLNFIKLSAPNDGMILTRIREPGAIVRQGDPIYTLSILSPVWVRAYIAEPYLGEVYPGMEAEVYTDTKDGKPYKGTVGFISPVAEFTPKTVETTQLRTDLVYRLRIYVEVPDRGLRQGMPVTVRLYPKLPKRSNDTSKTDHQD